VNVSNAGLGVDSFGLHADCVRSGLPRVEVTRVSEVTR
jgi:hypothetical protein